MGLLRPAGISRLPEEQRHQKLPLPAQHRRSRAAQWVTAGHKSDEAGTSEQLAFLTRFAPGEENRASFYGRKRPSDQVKSSSYLLDFAASYESRYYFGNHKVLQHGPKVSGWRPFRERPSALLRFFQRIHPWLPLMHRSLPVRPPSRRCRQPPRPPNGPAAGDGGQSWCRSSATSVRPKSIPTLSA